MNKKIIKNGSYSMVYTAILLAVLIVINLIVAEIPEEYTKIDVSDTSVNTMTDATKEYLDALEKDITIYYIVQNGNEDELIDNLLTRYEEYSKHVEVVKKDPVLYPTFTTQYTEEALDENSLIVVSGDNSKIVAYGDMYETEFDYTTYSYYTTGFNGESKIDSAIAYVTSENLPKLYFVEGHGELEISAALQESLENANYQIESLSLVSSDEVPEDTGCLMLVSPQTDISSQEAEKIISYLENGGKAMFFVDYVGDEFENLNTVLENYGVSTSYGIVMEGDSQRYIMQMPYYMLPYVETTDFTTDIINANKYILVGLVQPLEILESYRDTLVIEPFLVTSDKGYLKTEVENLTSFEKEDGDPSGEFPLALAITEELDEEKQTQIICYGGSAIIEESMDNQVAGANTELVLAGLGWMCENDAPVISVESKDLTTTYLVIPEYDAGYWAAITCGIIPVAFLLVGLFIWLKRRKQ